MAQEFLDVKSINNDYFEWNSIPYKKDGQSELFAPESKVISLHSDWSDMHFHYNDREKYTIFLNLYNIRNSNETRAQSAESTLEFTFMISNNIYSRQAGLPQTELKKGHFNITYLPFIDSKIIFKGNKLYITMDIHFKYEYLLESLKAYPQILDPLLNNMEHKISDSIFDSGRLPTAFMTDFIQSIINSIEHGHSDPLVMDKDVESLMAHAITYDPTVNLNLLNAERRQLMNEIYNHVIQDLSEFPGVKALASLALTNTTTLNTEFKRTFHTALKHCWNQYRLDEALNMVVHKRDKKIKEISNLTGYALLNNMTKAFKLQHHIAPQTLREDDDELKSIFQVNF